MKPGLIFDLDGTLIDSLPGIAASLNRALSSLDFPIHGLAAVQSFIGNGSLELARRAAPTGTTEDLVDSLEAAFKKDYAVTWPIGTAPYPGISECLTELHSAGFHLAVLSNKPHLFTSEIVARLFPNLLFSPVFGQRLGVPRKPDPEAALQIAHLWNLTPSDCRFIGDSIIDVATAKAAGIPAIGVAWGYENASSLLAAGAERVLASIADLISVFADC
jgi:phosphoglycolate phosphatase